jgi:VWFA-related protein
MDASGSMQNKLAESRQAVSTFLRLSSKDDEFFLVTIRDQPELVHGFTTKVEEVEADLAVLQPKGWTALYDAMYLAINQMRRANRTRRVLLVLSDGDDNSSRYNGSEIMSLVREADVRIFSISVQSHTPFLDKLAAESGGRAYPVRELSELPEVATKLSQEAHAQYVLGFTPPEGPRDGKYHAVKVELMPPTADKAWHLSWRRGYYSAVE